MATPLLIARWMTHPLTTTKLTSALTKTTKSMTLSPKTMRTLSTWRLLSLMARTTFYLRKSQRRRRKRSPQQPPLSSCSQLTEKSVWQELTVVQLRARSADQALSMIRSVSKAARSSALVLPTSLKCALNCSNWQTQSVVSTLLEEADVHPKQLTRTSWARQTVLIQMKRSLKLD